MFGQKLFLQMPDLDDVDALCKNPKFMLFVSAFIAMGFTLEGGHLLPPFFPSTF